jgi:hypothetical protein
LKICKRAFSDETIAALIITKEALPGMFNKRQLVFAKLDQAMHTTDKVDTAALYAKTLKDVMGLYAQPGRLVWAFSRWI